MLRVDRTMSGPGPLVDLALCVDGPYMSLNRPSELRMWASGISGPDPPESHPTGFLVQWAASLRGPGPLQAVEHGRDPLPCLPTGDGFQVALGHSHRAMAHQARQAVQVYAGL